MKRTNAIRFSAALLTLLLSVGGLSTPGSSYIQELRTEQVVSAPAEMRTGSVLFTVCLHSFGQFSDSDFFLYTAREIAFSVRRAYEQKIKIAAALQPVEEKRPDLFLPFCGRSVLPVSDDLDSLLS